MDKKPFVVGVAGGTCSGKSTLTDRLEQIFSAECRVAVFHMDQYFRKPSPTTIAPITRREYVEHNHPSTIDLDRFYADFIPAARGENTNGYDLVIAEGLFALYLDEIRELLDFKIFVDLKSDHRLVRRIKRFIARGQTFDEITDRYIDTVRFRHDELIEPSRWHADIVVNGTLDDNLAVDVLSGYIRSAL